MANLRADWSKSLMPLALAACLAGCDSGGVPQPAGLSRDEAEALNDAAEMLDGVNNGQDLPQPDPR